MSRLTITLDDSIHQALKEAAARQGRSIGKIIEEGLLLQNPPSGRVLVQSCEYFAAGGGAA